MKLIVGLGNPGAQYEFTRHNIGFMVIDAIADFWRYPVNKLSHQGHWVKANYKGSEVILLKPQTFMNLSGQSVRSIMHYYKINPSDILVIYDDLDLPLGQIRLREKGSSGGHNGMKSIIENLQTEEFKRLRIGIDKNPLIDAADYVLGRFPVEVKATLQEVIHKSRDAAIQFVDQPFPQVMNRFNR